MRIGLPTRTTASLMVIILVAVLGSTVAIVYAWHEKHMMDDMVSANVGDVVTMGELEIALLKQEGGAAAYIMDKGSRKRLDELERLEHAFGEDLDRVMKSSPEEEDRVLIRQVHEAFNRYVARRREVVAFYERGDTGAAIDAYLGGLSQAYVEAAAVADTLVEVNKRQILTSLAEERREIRRLTAVMASSVVVVAALGFGLIWLLFNQIFIPLRRIARDVETFSGNDERASMDDLSSLQYHMRMLLEEVSRSRADPNKKLNGDQAERLAAIGNAVASVAHEIRNRLATIGLFAQSVERHPEDPDRVRGKARTIFQASSRLEQMLAEVVEYSKPQRAPRSAHPLNDVVREAVAPLAEDAPPGVAIEIALDPAAPAIAMDPGAIEQVIINLVRNATEALENGGRVRVSTVASPGGARLVVEDDGPGIPAQIRERIFEPFFTTKKTGSGLGLSICRKIVSEHDAEMTVSSEPGRGTAFTVIFRNAGTDEPRGGTS